MVNYSSSDFDNFRDLKPVLDDTASDIAQVLPDISYWPAAIMYFMRALEFKAMELKLDLQREFEKTLRYILAGLNSRLGEGGWE